MSCIYNVLYVYSPLPHVVRWWAGRPPEETQADWRWAGQVLRGPERRAGETGAVWEKSCWRKWRIPADGGSQKHNQTWSTMINNSSHLGFCYDAFTSCHHRCYISGSWHQFRTGIYRTIKKLYLNKTCQRMSWIFEIPSFSSKQAHWLIQKMFMKGWSVSFFQRLDWVLYSVTCTIKKKYLKWVNL